MKLNVWGINYSPELTGIGVYSGELCEFLSAQGDQVNVVTAFPYYPGWRKQKKDRGAFCRFEVINGVNVYRCWQYVSSIPTVFNRIIHEASFVLTSFFKQLTLPSPDIYIIVSPPLLLGYAAWILGKIKQAPFVFHVQDLQPDAAIGLNMLKKGPFISLLYRLESFAYARSIAVSGISRQMCAAIKDKGVPAEKIILFPNWIALPELPIASAGRWKARHKLDKQVHIVSYSGNLGVKQGLETVLEAARVLAYDPRIIFVIAGDGGQKEILLKLKEQYKLTNVSFEDVLPEDEHCQLIMDSDIALVTQKPGSGSAFLPSKLLKILAYQKPVLSNADQGSALSQAIEEGKFGVTVSSGGEALSRAIVDLLGQPSRLVEMGQQGRKYVSQFDAAKVLPEFRQRLQNLVNIGSAYGDK